MPSRRLWNFSKLKDFLSGFISKKQVVDTALNIARSAGQKAGRKAIDFASSKWTPKSQQISSKLVSSTPPLAPQGVTPQKALPQVTTPNSNNLIAGSGQRAIKIQDFVRRLNKWTYQVFFWKAWSPQKQYRWTQIFQQGNTWFKVKTKKTSIKNGHS